MNHPEEHTAGWSRSQLGLELSVVCAIQAALVLAVLALDRLFGFGGVTELAGLIFLVLPLVVLDRRGRPYVRYGMRVGGVGRGVVLALLWAAICFPPIALAAPSLWGVGGRSFEFVWPAGYSGIILIQFLVVALPEEFFYRGYVMGRLDDIFRGRVRLLGVDVGWSLLIQAALFAVGHFVIDLNWQRLAVFFPALAFGWLRARTGGLLGPVLFHGLSNVFMGLFRAGLGLGI